MKGRETVAQQINILVVEDDNDINQLLCKIIKKSNYYAQPAYSGTEALIYLEKKEWDLVLLDLMLPGMTGEEILAEITSKGSVPVIIISAKRKKRQKLKGLPFGTGYLMRSRFVFEEVAGRIDF